MVDATFKILQAEAVVGLDAAEYLRVDLGRAMGRVDARGRWRSQARGTLGVVLLAKKRGIIPAARPVAESLRNAGLFVSADLLESSLRLVGE